MRRELQGPRTNAAGIGRIKGGKVDSLITNSRTRHTLYSGRMPAFLKLPWQSGQPLLARR